jgi:recombination protein RecA
MGDMQVGLQARLMSKALRKLTGAISRSKTCVIFINQIREKIGVMFGNPETTPGGRALKFYSSVRLDIRRTGALRQGDTVIGNRTRVRVVKNKVAPPFRAAEFDLEYGSGINYIADVLDMAAELGIVERSGSWFSFGEDRIGQGRDRVVQFLRENMDILEKIRNAALVKLEFAELIDKLPPLPASLLKAADGDEEAEVETEAETEVDTDES